MSTSKNKFLVPIFIIAVLLVAIVFYVPTVLSRTGNQALQRGDGVSADRDFAYAYFLNPWNKTFLEKRGQAQYWQGHFQEALAFYQRASRPNVNAQDYYSWLGSINLALGNYPAALVAYADSVGTSTVGTMSARSLNELAAASAASGNYDQGKFFAQWAIARALATGDTATEAKAYDNVGLMYAQQGNYLGSEKLLQQALSLWPTNPFIYDSLGELYSRWQKPKQALQAYEKVLALAPNFPTPLTPQLTATANEKIAALETQSK